VLVYEIQRGSHGRWPGRAARVLERRHFAFLGRVAQVLVEPAMRPLPCRLIRLPQMLAEPLSHEGMGVERVGR